MASDQERFLAKRVQSLEWELDREKRKNMDAHKALCKRDRLVKELTLKTEQDKTTLKDLQVVIADLESSLKIYKNKIDNVVSFTVFSKKVKIIILYINFGLICFTSRKPFQITTPTGSEKFIECTWTRVDGRSK